MRCVCIGQHDHIMETILTLRKPPYKGHNTHSSPLNDRQFTYRVIGTIDHTQQHPNVGYKTSSLLESKTSNHA